VMLDVDSDLECPRPAELVLLDVEALARPAVPGRTLSVRIWR
jgi:hypothetical protein